MTKFKLYIKQSDQMWHVLFWDNYGGRYGWHKRDDWISASGFLLKAEATAWAEERLALDENETIQA